MTTNELNLLRAISNGMDNPGEGWLHEIAPFENDHVAAGVLGSLIKKGHAKSSEEVEPGLPTCYWVSITPAGTEALSACKS